MMLNKTRIACFIAIAGVLSGCGLFEDDPVGGLRIDVDVPLEATTELVSDPEDESVRYYTHEPRPNVSRPLQMPPPARVADWVSVNANIAHDAGHHALRSNPTLVWAADIGENTSSKQRLSAAPVVAGGRVFAMDADSTVSAFNRSGERLWSNSLVPDEADSGEASSGGLGYGSGRLFATSGYGVLRAIDPGSGATLWTQRFEYPAIYPPVAFGNSVYLVTLGNYAWSINATTGRRNWRVESTHALGASTGEASTAIGGGGAFVPFPSGEVIAANAANGRIVWTHFVGGTKDPDAVRTIAGVAASPVLSGNRLYVSNLAGVLSALDASTGIPIWSVPEGSANAVLAVGDSVFAINDSSELVRLSAINGQRIWSVQLPHFTRESVRRRQEVHDHYGPLLVGGRILVASSDEEIRMYSPESGELVSSLRISGGAAATPAVVEGTLYVVSDNGRLNAYR
ncbi:MAG: PQQ-binding-like beta-propeller repeat protein [Rhodobacteraceae bacterium]|nr:PQQ-binding-like beta-propeller repeat protein [Paracoccaceae bacterium]